MRVYLHPSGRAVLCLGDGWRFVAERKDKQFTREEAEALCSDIEKLTKKLDELGIPLHLILAQTVFTSFSRVSPYSGYHLSAWRMEFR